MLCNPESEKNGNIYLASDEIIKFEHFKQPLELSHSFSQFLKKLHHITLTELEIAIRESDVLYFENRFKQGISQAETHDLLLAAINIESEPLLAWILEQKNIEEHNAYYNQAMSLAIKKANATIIQLLLSYKIFEQGYKNVFDNLWCQLQIMIHFYDKTHLSIFENDFLRFRQKGTDPFILKVTIMRINTAYEKWAKKKFPLNWENVMKKLIPAE